MASRVTGQEVLAETSTGSRSFTKGQYLDLTPDKNEGVTIKRVRLVGFPIVFYQCTEHQYDKTPGSKKGDKVKVKFPDAELNKSFTRIMREKTEVKDGKRIVTFEGDPWYEMGYIPQKRYAINCIDVDTNKVCILTKGQTLFEQFAKEESKNLDTNNELVREAKEAGEKVDPKELRWTIAGGEVAPEFKIKSVPDERWQVRYEVFPLPRARALTDEQIEMLRAVGAPTAEEIEKAREEDPSLKDMPDWFLYGYPLDKMFKPSEVKTESKREETSFSDEELDDPDFKPYGSKEKAKAVEVSVDDDDEDETPPPTRKVVALDADGEDEVPTPKKTKKTAKVEDESASDGDGSEINW